MFAFKIRFSFIGEWSEYYNTSLCNCIKDCHNSINNKMLFDNDESKIVCSNYNFDRDTNDLIAAFVFKNCGSKI